MTRCTVPKGSGGGGGEKRKGKEGNKEDEAAEHFLSGRQRGREVDKEEKIGGGR